MTWEREAVNQLKALGYRNPSPGLATFKELMAGPTGFPAEEPDYGLIDYSRHEARPGSWVLQVGWVAAVVQPTGDRDWLQVERRSPDSVIVTLRGVHVLSVGMRSGT